MTVSKTNQRVKQGVDQFVVHYDFHMTLRKTLNDRWSRTTLVAKLNLVIQNMTIKDTLVQMYYALEET